MVDEEAKRGKGERKVMRNGVRESRGREERTGWRRDERKEREKVGGSRS